MGTPDRTNRGGDGRYVRTPESAARDAEACRLRGQGLTFQQIADELGYATRADAHRAVSKSLHEIAEPAVAELRRASSDRLEYVAQRMMEILDRDGAPVTAGKDGDIVIDPATGEAVRDMSSQIAAARELRALSERLAKLYGLDAPAKQEITGQQTVRYEVVGVDTDALT